MRGVLILLSIVVIAVVGFMLKARNDANSTPTVQVANGGLFDVGVVTGNSPIFHTFHVVNPHNFLIRLSSIEPGCDCTTVATTSMVILPNGSVEITLKVRPEDGNLSGSASFNTSHNGKTAETILFLTGTLSSAKH
jgi:hypothetical protein